MTYLAVPIAAGDLDQAVRQIRKACAAGAEMLELRTDYLENLRPEWVVNLIIEAGRACLTRLAIIVTCRDERQGGANPYPATLRVDVLTAAVKAGAEFIDFEYENFLCPENRERIIRSLSDCPGSRLILSAHNFEKNFADAGRLYRDILSAYPNAIPKLVYTAGHINDCFEAFDLLHNTSGDLIVFCMGEAGLISRVITKKLNCFVTFASIDEENATAPGQLTIEQFRSLYRYDSIDADTKLFGVIADPVAHSLSPAIHNACLCDRDMNGLYLPLFVRGAGPEFDEFMDNVIARDWLDFRGFSVTIPHKHSALRYAKAKQGGVEPLAEKIGAVNTLVVGDEGRLAACNTDYAAALDAITGILAITRADLNGLSVAVIGAGGVARAVVAGLRDAGANIKIYNRTVSRGEKLAAEFDCEFAGLDELPKLDAKLVINCTSIGMYPNVDATPLPRQCLKADMTVFDTVYNPLETLLLRQAKEAGAKTIDGLSMFVNQALAQFRLFTGQDADAELMRRTVVKSMVD